MNRNLNTLILIVGIIAGITGLIFLSSYSKNAEITKSIETRKAKNTLDTLIMYTGNRHPLINESLKGKTVVINVWSTEFPASMGQIPSLNKLANDFRSDKVVFLGLNEGDVVEESKRMLAAGLNFDYKLSYSEKDMITLLYLLKLPTEKLDIPLNMVLNADGRIEYFYMGNEPEKLKGMREYLQKVK